MKEKEIRSEGKKGEIQCGAKHRKTTRCQICDDGTLIQILCFWALSIVLFLYKNTFLFIF
jgi:hypothetical protein